MTTTSIIETVKAAMATHVNSDHVSKDLGLSINYYRYARKLLLLQQNEKLSAQEQETIALALRMIDNPKRRISKAQKLTLEIENTYWQKNTLNGTKRSRHFVLDKRKKRKAMVSQQKKNKEIFERTIFTIRETCTNNEHLTIPKMTREEAQTFKDMLMESEHALFALINQLKC